uniref:non-specific serine/threonine protein kinase n=1 Tax=Cajanus cajan TaxID=3821 RepID=A0A151RQF6_CAJCA|nr:Cysteine-rich receptor-like protein kinase 10 [Cajanus cajan]
MAFSFSQSMLCFITFTCFLYIAKPSNLNQDTLLQGHHLTKSDRLISSSGWSTLSFFQCDGSEGFYLGVRPSSDDSCFAYFWVANRDMPIHDPSFLTIDQHGNLKIISNVANSTFMLYNSSESYNNSSTISAILQDNGNLMLREMNQDGSLKRLLWQSFDHPTDTFIPGMKLGFDRRTGQNWSITSWRSYKTPLSGSFTLGVDPKTKELVMWWRGNIVWSSGQWSNGSFVNLKSPRYQKDFVFKYFSDENSTYVTYVPVGYLLYSCIGDNFLYGCSMPSLPKCRNNDSLYLGNWSSYGVMSSKGFVFDESENLSNFDCWMKCLNNCTCEAYSYVNEDATGCEIWSKDSAKFVATNNFTAGGRHIYFLRKKKATSEFQLPWIHSQNKQELHYHLALILFNAGKAKIWIISAIVGTVVLIVLCFTCIKLCRKLKEKVFKLSCTMCAAENRKKRTMLLSEIGGNTAKSIVYSERREHRKEKRRNDDTHIFDLQTILEATSNFSSTNKIGEGGFGPVYKGKLPNGQEVAIKRLSKSSGQGLIEFKNEAMLIVKLQHTNLVKLLGFCIDKEERILVYEYLPNKSLNLYLFDSNKKSVLDWKIRCKIIEGIAQGLVYLHQYSRLKVIHRDLKASNILLDNELNPKISDFGMARIFGLIESEELTNRIVGTYGYMSPEYAMMGVISTKTDMKNRNMSLGRQLTNFFFQAWKLWNEGEGLMLMDRALGGSYPPIQVLRYIHVGLLCTQDQAIKGVFKFFTFKKIGEISSNKKKDSILRFIIFTCFFHATKPSNSNTDTLLQDHHLTKTDRLVSSIGWYTLSFFQYKGSEDFYLGVSYFWISNRDTPIRDPSFLTIDQHGNMKIISNAGNPTIMLYSSEADQSNNSSTAISAILENNGNFVLRETDQDGSVKRVKELVMWWRGNIVWSSGQWNNGSGSFTNLMSPLYKKDFIFNYFSDENPTNVTYAPVGRYIYIGLWGSIYGRVSGNFYSCIDNYLLSGCSMPRLPKCRDDDSLYLGNWSSYGVIVRGSYNFDCWMKCLNNCTCEAFSYVNEDESGCEIWIGARTQQSLWPPISTYIRQNLQVRKQVNVENRKKRTKLLGEIGGNTAISMAYSEIREQRRDGRTSDVMYFFDFQTILEEPTNFSSSNKIGEGGFGPVYKGKLPSGQEIALDKKNKLIKFGYMSPKYVMMGVISTKIDVYTFGILLLEILSGKKNSDDYPAWKLWNDGEALKLMDVMLDGSYSPTQVLRYIHIGLLCIQDQARDRPTMLEVVSFLSNEIAHLPST